METNQAYQKIVEVDMDIEKQGSNTQPTPQRMPPPLPPPLPPPRPRPRPWHGKLIRIGIAILCVLAFAFMIINCCPHFQTHHPLDYSQADSFYISNDPPEYVYDYDDSSDTTYVGEGKGVRESPTASPDTNGRPRKEEIMRTHQQSSQIQEIITRIGVWF